MGTEDMTYERINITDDYDSNLFNDEDEHLVSTIQGYFQQNDKQLYLDGSATKTKDYNDVDLVTAADHLVESLAADATKAHPGYLERSLKDMADQLERSYVRSNENLKSVRLAGPTINGVPATQQFESSLGTYVENADLDGGSYTGTKAGDIYLQDYVHDSSPIHLSFERAPGSKDSVSAGIGDFEAEYDFRNDP